MRTAAGKVADPNPAPAAMDRFGVPASGYSQAMSASVEETAGLLAHVGVFSELGRPELEQVARVAVPRSYAANEVVFREGDESNTAYVVRTGHARAVRQHSDGRTLTLAQFGPGEVFGELAMFDSDRRSATIEAVEDLELLAILAGDMHRLMAEHPDIAVKLVRTLGRRLREANDRLTRQSFQTVQSRVATVLAELSRDARSEGAADTNVLITATQAELAQLAGSSRESASRFLAVLERAGIITQGRGKLTVHDPAALQRYVF
jgi:CRP/FNR family transcriptional regulator